MIVQILLKLPKLELNSVRTVRKCAYIPECVRGGIREKSM